VSAAVGIAVAAFVVVATLAVAREQNKPGSFVASLLAGLGGVALSAAFSGNPVAMTLALGLVVAVLVGTLVGNTPSIGLVRAVRRYLTWGTLAVSALVVSGILDRLYARQPGPGILGAVAGLFVVGLGISTNVLPLSVWLPGLAEEAPLSGGAIAGLLTSSMIAIVATALAMDPWLLTETSTQRALATAGGAGGLLSVVIALGETRPQRVFAYLVSASGAFFVATLPTSPRGDSSTVVWFLGAQAIAVGLGFTCLAASEGKLPSLFARRPAAAIGLWVSGLSLLGLPLSAGYVGRALVAPTIAVQHPVFFVVAGATSAIGGLAATRSFGSVFQRANVAREPILPFDIISYALSALLIVAGLIPAPILAWLR
jgi:formate hydrogenlyase subunit 3/multisubunit Na+/H+ antiporter MnhD subunit